MNEKYEKRTLRWDNTLKERLDDRAKFLGNSSNKLIVRAIKFYLAYILIHTEEDIGKIIQDGYKEVIG